MFVGCGMRPENTGVMSPEIYTPAIDWDTGRYTDGEGEWETLTDEQDQATVPRGYHSVALLQPDGTVWTAGSIHANAELTDPDASVQETRIQVFRPSYGGNRPQIDSAPDSVAYDESFPVEMGDAGSVHRVAMVRCGSFTHAFDSDQRYLTLPFTQNGSSLSVRAPASSNLAPPGYYLLFVLRNANTPCERARFIRLAPQEHFPVLQLSTYSLLAVRALRPPYTENDEAVFAEAIDLIYQGYLPHELDIPAEVPNVTWEFVGGGAVPGMRIELNRQENEVDPAANPDTSQRFRFVYDVIFENEDAFDTFADDQVRNVAVRARLNGRTIDAVLTLMKRANPFMKDGDPAWLSTDLRIHKARVGDVDAVGGPQAYVQGLLDAFENSPATDESAGHPFDQLDTSQDDNPVVLAVPQDENGAYNFAIARVRYMSVPGEDAAGVKVFFRLFNTVGTALEYQPTRTYRTLDGVGGRIPGLGKQTFHITSIPFFAAPRVTPDEAMTQQNDNIVNRRTLFGQGPQLEFRYFGCWLDVNTRERHFPRFPQDDGPFGEEGGIFGDLLEGGPPEEMIRLVTGYHQCLVAEIQYDDDPTQLGQTPFTSDNLAQRNLATVWVANPGLEEITRTVQTSIDVKPSDAPTDLLLQAQPAAPASTTAQRFRADELVFSRNDLPPGTHVELYLPDVDVDEVLALSALRHGPPTLERVDDHTLRFELGEASYVALPGGRELNIAGLVSVTLPLGIVHGDRYRLTVKQYSGRTLRWVGAFELVIPVGHGPDLLAGEVEKLSILRYIFEAMPERDRWHPVFVRYLYEIGERVRGFGGDPDSVEPSPHGTGKREEPCPEDDDETVGCASGKVCDVRYDCFGDFDSFVLVDCDGRRLCLRGGKELERVVLMAWRERPRVTAYYRDDEVSRCAINRTCPACGEPVSRQALTEFEGRTVGFCDRRHRDRFARAVAAAKARTSQREAASPPAAANETCPWSGHRVLRDAVVSLSSGSVGFCSREHYERFLHAVKYFREVARYLDVEPGTGVPPVQHVGGHGDHGGQGAPDVPGGPDDHGGHGGHGGEQHGGKHEHEHEQEERPPSINRTCPWTGKPVTADALTRFEGHLVGFHRTEDRDAFEKAADLAGAGPAPASRAPVRRRPEHATVKATCPHCDRPASKAANVQLHEGTVRFCGSEHRDEFQRAVRFLRRCADELETECRGKLVRLILHC